MENFKLLSIPNVPDTKVSEKKKKQTIKVDIKKNLPLKQTQQQTYQH